MRRLSIPKILSAANGEDCTMKCPICNHNPETTVFCHLNESFAGKGLGIKSDDTAGFFACSSCHDWYDGRRKLMAPIGGSNDQAKTWYAFRACVRTWRRLVEKGILT